MVHRPFFNREALFNVSFVQRVGPRLVAKNRIDNRRLASGVRLGSILLTAEPDGSGISGWRRSYRRRSALRQRRDSSAGAGRHVYCGRLAGRGGISHKVRGLADTGGRRKKKKCISGIILITSPYCACMWYSRD